MIRALLFDVDGTLAETERDGHLVAFNGAFSDLGVPWRWSAARYGELLKVTGGRERLLFDMQSQPGAPAGDPAREALAARLHRLKNAHYARIVEEGGLALRPGVRELIEDCAAAQVAVAIVTTTSRSNLEALLARHFGPHWRARFAAVVCAEDAPRKKPDPEAYHLALRQLRLAAPDCLAIEDSPAGLAAARAAGIAVIVTRSHYFPDTSGPGALAAGDALGDPASWDPPPGPGAARIGLAQLARWHSATNAPPAGAREG
jgi:HAD superfamily hydrolase (TIGR01509 family)